MRTFSLLGLLCAASAALADATPRLGDVLSKTANLTKFNDLVQVHFVPMSLCHSSCLRSAC